MVSFLGSFSTAMKTLLKVNRYYDFYLLVKHRKNFSWILVKKITREETILLLKCKITAFALGAALDFFFRPRETCLCASSFTMCFNVKFLPSVNFDMRVKMCLLTLLIIEVYCRVSHSLTVVNVNLHQMFSCSPLHSSAMCKITYSLFADNFW